MSNSTPDQAELNRQAALKIYEAHVAGQRANEEPVGAELHSQNAAYHRESGYRGGGPPPMWGQQGGAFQIENWLVASLLGDCCEWLKSAHWKSGALWLHVCYLVPKRLWFKERICLPVTYLPLGWMEIAAPTWSTILWPEKASAYQTILDFQPLTPVYFFPLTFNVDFQCFPLLKTAHRNSGQQGKSMVRFLHTH